MSELIKVVDEREKIVQFIEQKVRRVWHNEEWYIVINDVVQVLTDSTNPRQYYYNLIRRNSELKEQMEKCEIFLPINYDKGKRYMKCANIEGIFRVMMNIPFSKAESLSMWLSLVIRERI